MPMDSLRSMGLLLILCCLLSLPVVAVPVANGSVLHYDYGFTPCISKLENQTHYVVSGVVNSGPNGTQGDFPVRLEIRRLQEDKQLWTLYLLGLDLMQSYNQTDIVSWFQISGIHGRPYQPWDGVQATEGNQESGYCTHASILFPTWHRPYLALYEQVLYTIIQQIAWYYEPGSLRDGYVKAAKRFRIPYWDWAAVPVAGQGILPDSVGGSPVVEVDGPNGAQEIAHPLFTYHFNPLDPTLLPDFPLSQWPETLRYPTSFRATATSQNSLVEKTLNSSSQSLRSRLYNLLTNFPSYASFSNKAFIPSIGPQGHDSLESLHDQIHGITGNNGHMSYVDYAAFDPIFILHHTMIDRCFALWQVLNPESFVVPQQAAFSTFTTSAGEEEDDTTALTPFRRDRAGTFWTSSSARYTETFGYKYPETNNPQGLSPAQMKNKVTAAIHSLYGSPMNMPNVTKRNLQNPIPRRHDSRKRTNKSPSTYQEWSAHLRISPTALNSAITIYLLLDPLTLPSDPLSWSLSTCFVGSQFVFAPKSTFHTTQANSQVSTAQQITAVLPLTYKILEKLQIGELASLDEDVIEAYLRLHLRYRIAIQGDMEMGEYTTGTSGNSNDAAVTIVVYSAWVTKAASMSDLPKWEPPMERFELDGG